MADDGVDMASYVHSLELERTALKITVSELEEQLADARAQSGLQHASELVEAELRRADVCEVRLWRSAWFAEVSGERVSTTLTLRNGQSEVHGDSLADALVHAKEAR